MAKTVPVRDDFEPLFFDEVGRLVVAAGRVEYVLKLCLKQLLGKGFTTGMLEAEKVRHLSSLCDEVSGLARSKLSTKQQKEFCALIETIKALAKQRNDVVHALWTTTTRENRVGSALNSRGKRAPNGWTRPRRRLSALRNC